MKEKIQALSLRFLHYLLPYLSGIFTAIVFTPVEFNLVGVALWWVYPIVAVPAFILWFFELIPRALLGPDLLFLLPYLLSFVSIVCGLAAHFDPLRRYQNLGPALIAFPIGFVGTAGVYLISMASI